VICGSPARFGYGLAPRPTTWACAYHRAKLEAEWVPNLYTPLPRLKKGQSARRQPLTGQRGLL
jgi:hypothetical protein